MRSTLERAQVDAPETPEPRWGFEEGEEIAPGRTALKRLGGGLRYDAYLSWDERLHAVVVCKVIRPHLVDDPHTLAGLAGEWEMLERLDHPVIVRGFDAILDGPRPQIVLEHLEGPRLSTLVRRYGPLPVEQLVPLAIQLCSGLHYLRTVEVVHLDVKPSNTIMGAPPRMIDLSVALTAQEAAELRSHVGTDAYMAPEQCAPAELGPVGPAADIWGLGVTLFKAATGELPFGQPEPGATEGPHRWPQLDREPHWPERAPDALAALITACLERDPARRPEPADLHEALEPILGGLPKPRLARLKPRL
jgi:eukaryotic-like serine/threonine-protein kinase